MISAKNRFHGQGGLKRVYAKGVAVRGGAIGLKYLVRDGRGASKPYRVAVVVSRKVHKSAVVRNRIRRRIYESIRTGTNQPKQGTDLVFSVFSDQVATMPPEKLSTLVHGLLQKTNNT